MALPASRREKRLIGIGHVLLARRAAAWVCPTRSCDPACRASDIGKKGEYCVIFARSFRDLGG
jgi:hypothetical protein